MAKQVYLKLKQRINEKGYSREEIARILNLHKSTVSKKLNGHYNFVQSEILKLSNALDIPREEIPMYFLNNIDT